VGLLLVLGLKAVTVAALPLWWAVPALVLGHTASRAAAVSLIRFMPYAGDVDQAKAKPLARRISTAGLLVALGWVALGCALIVVCSPSTWVAVLLALALAATGTVACGLWFHRRLGGITGDTLGATQQLTELLMLLGWLAWAGR
jgi:adenosylcobinamide-GDP ribazoletransferase